MERVYAVPVVLRMVRPFGCLLCKRVWNLVTMIQVEMAHDNSTCKI